MKRRITLFCAALAFLACSESEPEIVWCTGDGTEALVQDSDRRHYREAWSTTDHPACEGKPRGAFVFMDQQPTAPVSHIGFPRVNTALTISDTILDNLTPGEYFIADDFTVWEQDDGGWRQLTTAKVTRVWVGGEDSRYDHGAFELSDSYPSEEESEVEKNMITTLFKKYGVADVAIGYESHGTLELECAVHVEYLDGRTICITDGVVVK